MNTEHIKEIKDIQQLAGSGKRVIFVSGVFNIVHPGHLRLLRFAKECGDFLVVGVLKNTPTPEILNSKLRLEGIESIGFVDFAFILNEPPEIFVEELKPFAVVKGNEHKSYANPELKVLESYGGKLLFGSGDIIFSASDLLSKEFNELNFSTIKKNLDFNVRHGFTMNTLKQTLSKFQDLKVCVIGDTIVDEYIACVPLGMSQEDPTIVISPVQSEMFIGGAAIVAAHACSMGADVSFFSVVGKDTAKEFVSKKLNELGVNTHFVEDMSRPTTLKQRYRVGDKTMSRVSHLRQHDLSSELVDQLYGMFEESVKDIDLLIFSDFNYGCLPQSLVDKIINFCNEKRIMMVADSQSSSQVGDVSRFKGMYFLTPTEREARLATRDFSSGLVVLAEKLKKQAQAANIFITLGADGLFIETALASNNLWHTDKLPSFNTAPKDTAGAGDSFLVASSMASAVGADIWQSAYIGSLAAACQVGRVGNIPLQYDEIVKEIDL
jgi:rfaE bifunctional protein kinase chain/domain